MPSNATMFHMAPRWRPMAPVADCTDFCVGVKWHGHIGRVFFTDWKSVPRIDTKFLTALVAALHTQNDASKTHSNIKRRLQTSNPYTLFSIRYLLAYGSLWPILSRLAAM
jgi:hypothetical protein